MDLNSRRKYLSTCFACSCISNTTSSFVFSNWSVNSRHPDALLFNDHITPKTDSFKFTIAANFPVCGLSFQTQSGIILFYIACRLLKNILKVTLLKLAMLSWSWTPNLFIFTSASVYPDPSNMSAWSVGGWCWLDGVGGWVGGFCGLWVWGWWVCYMLELVFYGYTVVGILLIYFLCNIVQCVICACLSGLEESHPSGDSDLLLLALPG